MFLRRGGWLRFTIARAGGTTAQPRWRRDGHGRSARSAAPRRYPLVQPGAGDHAGQRVRLPHLGDPAMTDTPSSPAGQYGAYSEVGRLRKVLVCAPGLAHERLTPTNCDDLLFDEVIWVHNARRDHLEFVMKMRERGIEVVELHDLLSETLEIPEAKAWLLDRKI